MDGFPDAEQAYITLVENAKKSLPDAYCSLKNLDIVDKKTLLDTLYYFMGPYYHPSSAVRYPSYFLLDKSNLRIRKLKGDGYALNFSNTNEKKRDELLNSYFEAMMSYLPEFKLRIEPDLSFLKTDKIIEQTKKFRNHLEINISMLLSGPPNANQHTINPEKALKWVQAQKTAERQRLAQILLDHIRYISHSELLTALQTCVQKAKTLLKKDQPVIFITGSPKKSNYYISLLFAHFWLQEGLPIDAVLPKLIKIPLSLGGNFLDIDDMSYSGSQAETIISNTFAAYLTTYHDEVKQILEDDPAYNTTHMFLPRYLVEQTLNEVGFRYIFIRAFMSEESFQRLSNDRLMPKFPFQIATSEIIPYMPSVDPSDKKKIEYLFNDDVYATIYFDHKVADTPSTFLFPIAFGIVPEKSIVKTIGYKFNTKYVNEIEGEGVDFLPFIDHCSKEERPSFPTNRNNMTSNDAPNSYRCPQAWYKDINYEAGTYLPRGGKRTRKLKRRSKRKTRSTSK